jgi:hypothetical protein
MVARVRPAASCDSCHLFTSDGRTAAGCFPVRSKKAMTARILSRSRSERRTLAASVVASAHSETAFFRAIVSPCLTGARLWSLLKMMSTPNRHRRRLLQKILWSSDALQKLILSAEVLRPPLLSGYPEQALNELRLSLCIASG